MTRLAVTLCTLGIIVLTYEYDSVLNIINLT